MLNPKEKQMYFTQGKRVKVVTTEDNVIIGKCIEFTPSYNNEPEESSITMDSPTKDGIVCPWLMELLEHEIKSIELI